MTSFTKLVTFRNLAFTKLVRKVLVGFFTILVFNQSMAKQDEYTRYTIRVPSELYERLQRHASENGRSINAEVISLLEVALWEADNSRMEAGLPPLRPMTDRDRDFMEYARNRQQIRNEIVHGRKEAKEIDALIERADRILAILETKNVKR
jgi:hypothetical protein